MSKEAKIATAPRSEARLDVGKADQFVEAAWRAVDARQYDAGMLNAIHAAISAADAVAIALSGRRSADPDHQRAVDFLEEVGRASEPIETRVKQLRTLLSKKNPVEYESRRATAKEATDTVARGPDC